MWIENCISRILREILFVGSYLMIVNTGRVSRLWTGSWKMHRFSALTTVMVDCIHLWAQKNLAVSWRAITKICLLYLLWENNLCCYIACNYICYIRAIQMHAGGSLGLLLEAGSYWQVGVYLLFSELWEALGLHEGFSCLLWVWCLFPSIPKISGGAQLTPVIYGGFLFPQQPQKDIDMSHLCPKEHSPMHRLSTIDCSDQLLSSLCHRQWRRSDLPPP